MKRVYERSILWRRHFCNPPKVQFYDKWWLINETSTERHKVLEGYGAMFPQKMFWILSSSEIKSSPK